MSSLNQKLWSVIIKIAFVLFTPHGKKKKHPNLYVIKMHYVPLLGKTKLGCKSLSELSSPL